MKATNSVTLFAKVFPNAIIPTISNTVGFDLYALEDTLVVGGGGNVNIPTGITIKLPFGTYGRIIMKPDLASDQHLIITTSIIDRNHTGSLNVGVTSTKLFDIHDVNQLEFRKEYERMDNWMMVTEPACLVKVPIKEKLCADDNKLCEIVEIARSVQRKLEVNPVLVPHAYLIKEGECFAQLIIENVSLTQGLEVDDITNGGCILLNNDE